MKSAFSAALMGLSLSLPAALAAAVPKLDARAADCTFNTLETATWIEAGMTRHRINFSGGGTDETGNPLDLGKFCDGWLSGGATFMYNPQCYFNNDINSWVVEVNAARGPGGDSVVDDANDYWRGQFISDHQCRTG